MEEYRKIKDYSKDELRKLYKSYSLYLVTYWFKHLKTYKKDENLTLLTSPTDCTTKQVINELRIETICDILNNGKYNNDNEKTKLECERTVLNICNEVLYWCGGGFTQTVEWFREGKQVQNPYDLFHELHMNDDIDIKFDKATKFDIYVFIWETLRFCSLEELTDLLKYADEKFATKVVGRPKLTAKIYKYDKNDKLIAIYNDRQSCIEANRMTKGTLSKILKGDRHKFKEHFYYLKEE